MNNENFNNFIKENSLDDAATSEQEFKTLSSQSLKTVRKQQALKGVATLCLVVAAGFAYLNFTHQGTQPKQVAFSEADLEFFDQILAFDDVLDEDLDEDDLLLF